MKKLHKFNVLKIFAVIAVLAGGALAQGADNLSNQVWHPTHVNGRVINAPDARFEMTIQRTRFSATVGCNDISGGVRVNGRNLRFSNVVSTRKFCSETGVMRNEADLIRALEQTTRYTENGRVLRFFARNREVVRFDPAVTDTPDETSSRLDDRKWVLEEIKGRPIGRTAEQPFISFDDAKFGAGGNTGCNSFGGTYIDKRDRIKIFDVISTLRACVENNRMNIEREFLSGLQETDRFRIRGNRLMLYNNNTLLLTFRGERK